MSALTAVDISPPGFRILDGQAKTRLSSHLDFRVLGSAGTDVSRTLDPFRGHRRPSHSESGVSGSNDLHRFWDVCYVGHADDIKKHLWLRSDSRHNSRSRDPMMDPGLGPRKILGIPEVPIFRRGPSSDAEIMDVCHDIIRSVIPNMIDDMS